MLRRNLALLAIEGDNPVDALHAAARTPLQGAHDPAAVLDWRLPPPSQASAGGVGPLRWLPAIPGLLDEHPQWGPYLRGRAALVSDLAEQIRDTARAWAPNNAPAWARPLLDQRPALMAEIAVFRAAHNVDPADTRITGPEQHANRSALVQQLIHSRLDADLTRAGAQAARWRQMAEQIDPHITNDPFWPRLAGHLEDAARAGADVAALLHQATSQHGPLPDEMPAAALWWRLAGTLAPPSLDRVDTKLRPPWTAELHHLLGTRIAETVITDPAWPALVAAVAASGWPPADLLAAAAEHLHDIDATGPIRPDQYARLLTLRIELLTHHAATIDPDIPHPADYAETPSVGEQFTLYDQDVDTPPDLHEPPPDLDGYPYGFAEDDLGGLDIADLPLHRPTPSQPGDHTDIAALRVRRDAARQHAQQLADAVLRGGGGPAERAAARDLADLHRRLSEQRPYQRSLARAHALWVHAEDSAELHHQLLEQLTATITAARACGDHHHADQYQQHRGRIAHQTPRIDTAVRTARTRLDTARAELIRAAGGVDNIVTEQHLHARRAAALRVDTEALTAARRDARDLDNQLARAESLAARSFAQNPVHTYDLAADIPLLRTEVELLHAAATTSPAASYHPPDTAVHGLDEPHRRAVTAITSSAATVQPLLLHSGADKGATLAAIAATAHHHSNRVLALPVTPAAAQYAAHNRYADTTTTPAAARTHLDDKRWKLPAGSLLIIDDADHLGAEQLRWLTETAAAANTKLILISTPDRHRMAPNLLSVLTNDLPSTQHLGTPQPDRQQAPTAIQRVEHHLAATTATSTTRNQASELLARRNQILERLREIGDTAAHIDTATARQNERERHRGRDREHGLEL